MSGGFYASSPELWFFHGLKRLAAIAHERPAKARRSPKR